MYSSVTNMCYTQLSRVFRRLNMLSVSRFQNFSRPGFDDGSSSIKAEDETFQKCTAINK